jgi:polar amino acid transport system substrate-binding protein
MLEFGRAAGTCIVPADPERRPYLVYSQPLFESRELLFYNPDQTPNFVFSGFADLNGLTIGLVDGYAYGAQFERAIADLGLTVERSDTSQENFRKLVAGRIDTAVEDEAVAYALLADNEWMDRLAWSKKIISRYSYHVGLSKSSGADRLLDAVNRVLRRLRESGELGSGYPHLPMGS